MTGDVDNAATVDWGVGHLDNSPTELAPAFAVVVATLGHVTRG